MPLLKLTPACKDYLWGGDRLKNEYHKRYDGLILAETWELSCHPDGPSVIANGSYQGRTLQEYIEAEGREVLGLHCRRFREFPILIKFIDAKDNLSIQVHPDNHYALEREGQYGKTEMWYVMDAGEDAYLYYGFKREISREEFERRIQEDTLLEVLNAIPVQKGDILFIESGTIHAIGKDILIAEIQQNSNVTYRVYDYGRVGKDGKKRDLHIEKALDVTRRVPIVRDKSSYPHVADCDYFTVDKLNLDGAIMGQIKGIVSEDSFVSILFLDGFGTIRSDGDELTFQKGDSFFLSAGSGSYEVEGTCEALVTSIREKAAPVRVGISLGGSETRVGLVDIHHDVIASKVIPTESILLAEEMLEKAAQTALDLMEDQKIAIEQCIGVGIGIPGTVDWKNGKVLYSNNIRWKQVDVAGVVGKLIPVPVRVANNADCAALGEHVAGAGKECQNIVMVTLGTGVGGGIIINGRIFEGSGIGGSELGHMVIVKNGKRCTCGRKGCLEAYASLPALRQAAKDATGIDMTAEEIFTGAGKASALALVKADYIDALGTGIVNMVNIFRPQLVLIGGLLSEQVPIFIEPIQKMIELEAFGGVDGSIPEVEAATLGKDAGMIGAACLI